MPQPPFRGPSQPHLNPNPKWPLWAGKPSPAQVSGPVANQVNLTATLTFAGTSNRQTNRLLAAGLSFTGALANRAGKTLAAVLSLTGALVAGHLFARALTGALGFTGASAKQATKTLAGIITSTGTFARNTSRTLAAVLSFTGSIAKRTARVVAAAVLSSSGTLAAGHLFVRALTGTLSFAGSTAKRAGKTLAATLTTTGAAARSIVKTLAATLSFSGAAPRRVNRLVTGALSFTGTRAARIARQLAGALTSTGAVAGQIIHAGARALGSLIVTVASILRPIGLLRARALGNPTTLGRDLQPSSLTHTRTQGNPTLSARALPPSLTHTRALGPIYVNSIRTPALDRGNQYPKVILADTPAGYWRLDEPAGTLAADTSGHSLNGLYQGSPILGSPSLLASDADASAKFNGTTQNVDITGNPAALQLASGTVECWVSPTGHSSGFTGIVSKNGAYFLGFNVNTNTLATFDFHNSVARVSGTTLTNGTTYHLVLTFQSGVTNGTQIWVNGVSILTTTITVQSQANDLTLASNTPGTQDYPGTLDEVAAYNYVLTPTQIAAHYATGISATTRAQGTPNTTTQGVIRPTGQTHARAQGNPTAHGRQTITTTALDHTRSQGNPTLSGRALPLGLAHARALGSPEINLLVLHPLALSRA